MNKYLLALFVSAFVLMGFSSAHATNCAPGDLFHSMTGERCGTVSSGSGSSEDNGSAVSTFNAIYKSSLKVGTRGTDVRVLQQFLKDEGYYFGKVDGRYGKITDRAVNDFKEDNYLTIIPPIFTEHPVISGVKGPQSLEINQAGTWTVSAYSKTGGYLSYSVVWGDEAYTSYMQGDSFMKVPVGQSATFTHSYSQAGKYIPTFTVTSENTIYCITTPCPTNGGSAKASLSVNVLNPNTSSLTVLSPNGGEFWTKDAMQTIKWQDNSTYPICPEGAYCMSPAPKYYDIYLSPYYPPCTGQICPALAYIEPYTIAKSIYGTSHSWSVGQILASQELSHVSPDGLYLIKVCQTGTGICDSSDSYFKISSYITY